MLVQTQHSVEFITNLLVFALLPVLYLPNACMLDTCGIDETKSIITMTSQRDINITTIDWLCF